MFSRICVALAALLIIPAFFFPLWQISLKAPQYPEGLALQIWTDKITGDVRNINVLNHYIGMSKIEPDKLRELKIFPYAFAGFAGVGLICAALNRRKLNLLWSTSLLLFASLSLYDFYAWEYDFGHNLNEDAPMKLEESYQPPLLGEKQLANITASSWPMYGGYAFSAAGILAAVVFVTSLVPQKPKTT